MSLAFHRALLCALVLGGCSFEGTSAEGGSLERNVCASDSDCGTGASCSAGRCMARSVESGALSIALEVTPARSLDGSSPMPITLDAIEVQGPLVRTWTLPQPVGVAGRVRNGDAFVAADLSFTPTRTLPGVTANSIVSATASGTRTPDSDDFAAQLLRGVEYRMRVQPADASLPPVVRVFEAGRGAELDVDYASLSLYELRFEVDNAPEGRELMVRAFDPASGQRLSSTGFVTEGEVVLTFAEEPSAYRLVVEVDEGYVTREGGYVGCGRASAVLPALSIASESLPEVEDGLVPLMLPTLPELVRYEGSIELCDHPDARVELNEQAEQAGGSLQGPSIPVALRSRGTMLGGDDGAWTATLNTSADALYDEDTKRFRFCLDAVPGQYELVATPPSAFPCEIFAEQRTIHAPTEDGAVASALVELQSTAFLSGTLQTQAAEPIPGASVDALSLGRRQAVPLLDEDASLTAYNRSRQTTTAPDGTFRLPVDLGSYDVTLKPPVSSGFAWQVHRDVTIGTRDFEFSNVIGMAPPLMLEGAVRYDGGSADQQALLTDAEITAYALVEDVTGTERAIPVGKTTADASGRFTLLIPSALRSGW